MMDTQLLEPAIGMLAITHRDLSKEDYLLLSIGGAPQNEMMPTMGFSVANETDEDDPRTAGEGRGWKVADGYVLIEGNELLICVDGIMRASHVEWYLRKMISQDQADPSRTSFGIFSRITREAQKTLDAEGVKSIEVKATAYAVSLSEKSDSRRWLSKFKEFVDGLRSSLEVEAPEGPERETFVNHLADLSVTATINVKGGTRGEPVVVNALREVADDSIAESPEFAEITLRTGKNNPIKASQMTLSATKSIQKLRYQIALDHTHAWRRIEEYRTELIETQRWKE